MKPLEHIKIVGRGVGYSLLIALFSAFSALFASFIARWVFSFPCYPVGMGCKEGLLPINTHFIIKQIVSVGIFLIPVVVLSPFAFFAKVFGFFLNESVAAFPSTLADMTYPTSFHLAFWTTIVYYVVVGILVSYYRMMPIKHPFIRRILKAIAIFHIAVAVTSTVLTVQLYP